METILDLDDKRIQNFRFAGFWIRFAAAFIDGLIVSAASSLLALIFLGGSSYNSFTSNPYSFSWMAIFCRNGKFK